MTKKISIMWILGVLLIMGQDIQGRADDAIKIGAIFAKTGVASEEQLADLQGVRIAVNEINKQGGVLGKQLELVEFDNRSTLIGSKVAADKAVKAEVISVIGAAWSSHSIAVAPVLQKTGIPMISPVSTNPKVTQIGDYIFRVCFIDPFQGEVMAQFARRELQATTAVILVDLRSDYSIGLAQTFRKHFEEEQGQVLLELHYKQKQEDFTTLLQQAKQVAPDALFIPGHSESGFIAKQAQDMEITAFLLGGDGWGGLSFLGKGGQELKQAYYSTHWSMEIENEISQSFVKRYGQMGEIEANTALAYDAVMLLADAIRRVGAVDRTKIRDALAETQNFQGVTGNITFDNNGDPVKSAVIMQIVEGTAHYFKTVSP